MSQINIDNIKAVYQLATSAERIQGLEWYPQALRLATDLRENYNVTSILQVVGVIAALSPRNKWSRNQIDAEALIGAYVAGGADQAAEIKCCTFKSNRKKAIEILSLKEVNTENVQAILSGPKLREFYSCIIGLDDICIDGHAWCIWDGGRCSLKDVPRITKKSREEIKNDYRVAAESLGIEASALQAITWCTWRRIHGVG